MLNNNKGAALIMTIIILLFLSIIGFAFLTTSSSEANFTKYSENNMQAYYLARSGAEAMIKFVNFTPTSELTGYAAAKALNPDLTREEFIRNTLNNLNGQKSTNISFESKSPNFVVQVDKIGTNKFQITSKGTHNNISNNVIVEMNNISPFDYTIYSIGDLDTTPLGGPNAFGISGKLGSKGSITTKPGYPDEVDEYYDLQWDVLPLPSYIYNDNAFAYNFSFTEISRIYNTSNGNAVTIDKRSLGINISVVEPDSINIEPLDVAYEYDSSAINGNSNTTNIIFFTKPGKELKIVTDDINWTTSKNINVIGSGYVSLYVTKSANINTGNVKFLNAPDQFAMFMSKDANFTLSGNGQFVGFIYAPESTVFLDQSSGTDIYGSIIAENFSYVGLNSGNVGEVQPEDESGNAITWTHPGVSSVIKSEKSILYRVVWK